MRRNDDVTILSNMTMLMITNMTIMALSGCFQVAEKRAHSMEAATEFIQGGEGETEYASLLSDVLSAADGVGGCGDKGRELAKLQQKV